MLIFDLDYPTSVENAIDKCLNLGIEPTWCCATTKGVHIAYTLENCIMYDWDKTIAFARHVKKAVAAALGADPLGSHRLKGIWRNPLATEHYYSGLKYSLNDFRHILAEENKKTLTLDAQFALAIKPRKVLNFALKEGNRNNHVWYRTMARTKSKNFVEVLAIAKEINANNLEAEEVLKIATSVHKYNTHDSNFVGSKKWNWDYVKKDKGEVIMTRTARALANAEKREQEARKKVLNLTTGMFAEEYRKKSGSWHISKIAKDTNLHRETVAKHLKGEAQCNTK